MTLPKASKFPALPEGYHFELEHEGVNYTHRENEYSLWVLPLENNRSADHPLLSELHVIESYVLDAARRLAELAHLEVAARGGDTKTRVGGLNHELRLRAK